VVLGNSSSGAECDSGALGHKGGERYLAYLQILKSPWPPNLADLWDERREIDQRGLMLALWGRVQSRLS